MFILYLLIVYSVLFGTTEPSSDLKCNVRAHIESGWICGLIREAELGEKYASFRGVPYGQQPLGELRFKELQPVKPWHHYLDATEEGPICPQVDELYGRLIKPEAGMSESCIYANIHVPLDALPDVKLADKPVYSLGEIKQQIVKPGYPILVFIHGGGFHGGSGNTDLHGPEYLVSKGIIVITFNYRLNVFGFLSLNTPKIPGNAGLRDQVTLLRWVQRNAKFFGGNQHDVTLVGQSAGATSAHLLALSKETKGLFKRVMLMSGTAITSYYTTSPVYASTVAALFMKTLGINATNPDVIHDQLIKTPIEDIINALIEIHYETGLVTFVPIQETKYPGITRIVDDDPMNLIQQGRDKEYPMIIGFTNNECEFFKYRLQHLQMLRRIKENPTLVLAVRIIFSTPPNVALYLAKIVVERYFHEKLNYDDYLDLLSETIFQYPAFQLARWRAKMDAAPSYLYQFTYESKYSVLKDALNLKYKGSAHVEDLTYIFRSNAMLGYEKSFPPKSRDDIMKDWMTMFIVNFIRCNDPSCGNGWPPLNPHYMNYQLVNRPGVYVNTEPSQEEWDMIHFHDMIDQKARNSSKLGILPDRDYSP